MNPSKQLVVNADDYGITESISKGILDACARGIVTSISIITNTPSFDKTIPWIKDRNIDTGIHLTLNSWKPLSSSLNTLPVVRRDGSFWQSPLKTPFFYFSGNKEWRLALRTEFRMQIERLLNAGAKITHLDSHFHIHVFPFIASVISGLVRDYSIPYVRRPYETNMLKKMFNPAHDAISRFASRNCSIEGARFLPFYGLIEAGRITKDSLIRILKTMNTQTGELMIHPGYNSGENLEYYPKSVKHFEEELRAATDSQVASCLVMNNIRPVRRNEIKQ